MFKVPSCGPNWGGTIRQLMPWLLQVFAVHSLPGCQGHLASVDRSQKLRWRREALNRKMERRHPFTITGDSYTNHRPQPHSTAFQVDHYLVENPYCEKWKRCIEEEKRWRTSAVDQNQVVPAPVLYKKSLKTFLNDIQGWLCFNQNIYFYFLIR